MPVTRKSIVVVVRDGGDGGEDGEEDNGDVDMMVGVCKEDIGVATRVGFGTTGEGQGASRFINRLSLSLSSSSKAESM
jgi:hypothetical protein